MASPIVIPISSTKFQLDKTITAAGGSVSIDVCPNGSRVYVRVADSGPGIAEVDRARIFERFVQLDPSRRAEGTGLGLTIAKWIAEAHHGSLTLESSGAAGSTFCVDLPSVTVAAREPEASAPSDLLLSRAPRY